MSATCPIQLILLPHMTLIVSRDKYKSWSPSLHYAILSTFWTQHSVLRHLQIVSSLCRSQGLSFHFRSIPCRIFPSSGARRLVDWYISANVSEEICAYIFTPIQAHKQQAPPKLSAYMTIYTASYTKKRQTKNEWSYIFTSIHLHGLQRDSFFFLLSWRILYLNEVKQNVAMTTRCLKAEDYNLSVRFSTSIVLDCLIRGRQIYL
jgi:hypothetical protein